MNYSVFKRKIGTFVRLVPTYLRPIFIKVFSLFIIPDSDKIAFIPHGGMYDNGYGLLNFKSDNALSLLNYMIKRYGIKYKYRLACDSRQYLILSQEIRERYPELDISCILFFGPDHFKWSNYKELIRCKTIFTSEGYPLPFKKSWHKVIFLSYYKPFKDDYHLHHQVLRENFKNIFDICVAPSALYSNIVSHVYNVPLDKFVTLGFSRDDELLSSGECSELNEMISNAVDYVVKKVFLYTPTHRDYEQFQDNKRDVLGFSINKKRFESFLQSNGILLICKIHTHQNQAVLNDNSIKGVVIHNPTAKFGLCELLRKADCLITDYTSTYFDFILLDRPVLFNFYDFEKYRQTRGFSFDPIDPIIAGGVFTDEDSFYTIAQKVIDGVDDYAEKRRFVRDLMHKYTDNNSSKRICDYILGEA